MGRAYSPPRRVLPSRNHSQWTLCPQVGLHKQASLNRNVEANQHLLERQKQVNCRQRSMMLCYLLL